MARILATFIGIAVMAMTRGDVRPVAPQTRPSCGVLLDELAGPDEPGTPHPAAVRLGVWALDRVASARAITHSLVPFDPNGSDMPLPLPEVAARVTQLTHDADILARAESERCWWTHAATQTLQDAAPVPDIR